MKKTLLLSAICLLTIAACEKDPNGGGNAGPDAPEVEFKNEAVAGSKIVIASREIAKDAKFSLKGGITSDLESKTTAIGVEVVMPYTLGKYTLCLQQEGNSFDLGEILVKVDVPDVPGSANKGTSITVYGSGFASDAGLVLDPASGNRISLETTKGEGSLSAKLPETPGTYRLSVVQAGTEQILKEGFVIEDRESRTVISRFSTYNSNVMNASYEYVYSGGQPTQFKVKTQTSETTFNITAEGDTYRFTDAAGKEQEFSLTLEAGRVKTSSVNGSTKDWIYDSKGHLTSAFTHVEKKFAWENDNIMIDENASFFIPFVYDGATETSKTEQDIAMLQTINIGYDPEEANLHILYAASLGGWCGTKSMKLPAGIQQIFPQKTYTFTYTQDNGMVTGMEYKNQFSVPFRFEYIYSEI